MNFMTGNLSSLLSPVPTLAEDRGRGYDTIVTVSGRPFPVKRSLLSKNSGYFRTILLEPISSSSPVTYLNLAGLIPAEYFAILLKAMSEGPASLSADLDRSNVYQVLLYAQLLQMPQIFIDECNAYILRGGKQKQEALDEDDEGQQQIAHLQLDQKRGRKDKDDSIFVPPLRIHRPIASRPAQVQASSRQLLASPAVVQNPLEGGGGLFSNMLQPFWHHFYQQQQQQHHHQSSSSDQPQPSSLAETGSSSWDGSLASSFRLHQRLLLPTTVLSADATTKVPYYERAALYHPYSAYNLDGTSIERNTNDVQQQHLTNAVVVSSSSSEDNKQVEDVASIKARREDVKGKKENDNNVEKEKRRKKKRGGRKELDCLLVSQLRNGGDPPSSPTNVQLDVASCDGPVHFQRIVNPFLVIGAASAQDDGTNVFNNEDHDDDEDEEDEIIDPDVIDEDEDMVGSKLGADQLLLHSQGSTEGEIYRCLFCNHIFKSHYCYQKHKRRHLNPLTVDFQRVSSSSTSSTSSNNIPVLEEQKKKILSAPAAAQSLSCIKDINVQFFPCKICGAKFPSYYFVHKHKKIWHAEEMAAEERAAKENNKLLMLENGKGHSSTLEKTKEDGGGEKMNLGVIGTRITTTTTETQDVKIEISEEAAAKIE